MTDRRWRFSEGNVGDTVVKSGTTAGTTIVKSDATANEPGGVVLDTVSKGTSGSILIDTLNGARCITLTNDGTSPVQVRYAAAAAHSAGDTDITIGWPNQTDSTRVFLRARYVSGYIFSLARRVDGKFEFQPVSGNIVTSSVALPLTVRFDPVYTLAAGANSSVTIKCWSTTGTLLDTVTVTNVDLGATSYSLVNFEIFNSGTTIMPLKAAYPAIRDSAATSIGPVVSTPVAAIAGLTATRVSNTQVTIAWTQPSDAPNGVTVLRAAGTQTVDAEGDGPGSAAYNPDGLTGATIVAAGVTSGTFTDTVPSAGTYTYWVARNA